MVTDEEGHTECLLSVHEVCVVRGNTNARDEHYSIRSGRAALLKLEVVLNWSSE